MRMGPECLPIDFSIARIKEKLLSRDLCADEVGDEVISERQVQGDCAELCADWTPEGLAEAEAALRAAFPLLPLSGANARLLRRRRCRACEVVSRKMAELPEQTMASCKGPHCAAPLLQAPKQILCRLQVIRTLYPVLGVD